MGIMREPMEAESDSDEDYSLDKIVERRIVNGELRYFLKWKCTKSPDVKETSKTKRQLECPIIMDAFEKSSKEKKPSKNDTKDKKKVVQNSPSPVVSETPEAEKKKVHSKTCKSYLHSKKVEAEDKIKEKKQKHVTSEDCIHHENKVKDDKEINAKPIQPSEPTDATESTLKTTAKITTANLDESNVGKEKTKNP